MSGLKASLSRVRSAGPAAKAESPGIGDAVRSTRLSVSREMPPHALTSGSSSGTNAASRSVSSAARRKLSAWGCAREVIEVLEWWGTRPAAAIAATAAALAAAAAVAASASAAATAASPGRSEPARCPAVDSCSPPPLVNVRDAGLLPRARVELRPRAPSPVNLEFTDDDDPEGPALPAAAAPPTSSWPPVVLLTMLAESPRTSRRAAAPTFEFFFP